MLLLPKINNKMGKSTTFFSLWINMLAATTPEDSRPECSLPIKRN